MRTRRSKPTKIAKDIEKIFSEIQSEKLEQFIKTKSRFGVDKLTGLKVAARGGKFSEKEIAKLTFGLDPFNKAMASFALRNFSGQVGGKEQEEAKQTYSKIVEVLKRKKEDKEPKSGLSGISKTVTSLRKNIVELVKSTKQINDQITNNHREVITAIEKGALSSPSSLGSKKPFISVQSQEGETISIEDKDYLFYPGAPEGRQIYEKSRKGTAGKIAKKEIQNLYSRRKDVDPFNEKINAIMGRIEEMLEEDSLLRKKEFQDLVQQLKPIAETSVNALESDEQKEIMRKAVKEALEDAGVGAGAAGGVAAVSGDGGGGGTTPDTGTIALMMMAMGRFFGTGAGGFGLTKGGLIGAIVLALGAGAYSVFKNNQQSIQGLEQQLETETDPNKIVEIQKQIEMRASVGAEPGTPTSSADEDLAKANQIAIQNLMKQGLSEQKARDKIYGRTLDTLQQEIKNKIAAIQNPAERKQAEDKYLYGEKAGTQWQMMAEDLHRNPSMEIPSAESFMEDVSRASGDKEPESFVRRKTNAVEVPTPTTEFPIQKPELVSPGAILNNSTEDMEDLRKQREKKLELDSQDAEYSSTAVNQALNNLQDSHEKLVNSLDQQQGQPKQVVVNNAPMVVASTDKIQTRYQDSTFNSLLYQDFDHPVGYGFRV